MDMLTLNEITQVRNELARIADVLEKNTPLNRLPESTRRQLVETVGGEPVALQTEGYNLAEALAGAVVHDVNLQVSGQELTIVRESIIKFANRYFANAQDTSDKLAQAYSELHDLRRKSGSEFLRGLTTVQKLVQRFEADRTVEFGQHKIPSKLSQAVTQLVELNQPFTTEVDAGAEENAG